MVILVGKEEGVCVEVLEDGRGGGIHYLKVISPEPKQCGHMGHSTSETFLVLLGTVHHHIPNEECDHHKNKTSLEGFLLQTVLNTLIDALKKKRKKLHSFYKDENN